MSVKRTAAPLMNKSKTAYLKSLETFINSRSHNPIERQRLIIYLIATVLAVAGMSLHFVGVIGAADVVLRGLSFVYLASSLTFFILWIRQKLSLSMAFTAAALMEQAVQTARIIYIVVVQPPLMNMFICGNVLVSIAMMVLLAISYLRIATIIVGGASMVTIVVTAAVLGDRTLWQLAVLDVLFTVFFCLLTDMMYRNVKHMQDENTVYHRDERQLLQVLRLNRKEIEAYVEMCRTKDLQDADTDRLFSMLSEASQRNVIHAVERKLAIDSERQGDIKNRFPTFTASELEVANLIVRGMRLSQICELTGKTESNISTVRSHIRKKMGLQSNEDLREALLKEIKG